MKKTYKKLMALTGAFGLFAITATAQISGVVTINSAAATGGTNYQSFTALATALNTSGINGPLTVNVVSGSGPYTEQPDFGQIAGTSSTNRIIINGNGNWINFSATSSAAPWTMRFNGTDWVTVNNLNIYGSGSSFALTMILTNQANNNTFSACTFSCLLNSTSFQTCPFAISSSGTSLTGGSNSGNFNTVTSCTMANGYWGVYNYGLTSAPYQQGNTFDRCLITDWWIYGIYYPYQMNCTIKNCIVERPTRATSSTFYGFAGWFCQGAMIDGNIIRKCYGTQTNATGTCFLFYTYYNAIQNGLRNTVRNNIATEVNTSGTIYGLYTYYMNGDCYNNTLDLDRPTVNQSGAIYGAYPYGGVGYTGTFDNNLITIRRPGFGSRWGNYVALTGNLTMKNNNIVHTPSITTSYYGYYNSNQATLANWITAGGELNPMEIDPMYVNQALNDLHPSNPLMNDMGAQIPGLVFDQEMSVRNPLAPDVGALEFLQPACSGAPGMNSVTSPTFAICPGENVNMTIASLTASTGLTYQWSASNVSNVGPFTPIAGANSLFLAANQVTQNTWYQVVQTCTLPGGGSSAFVGTVTVSGPTSSMVPAYEGFEGIGLNNRLPNCSWLATDLGNGNKTYTTSGSNNRVPRNGTSFGAFDNAATGARAYYTNDIAMNAGITYSAAIWYATEYFGFNNWSNLQILVGPNQSTVGATVVASVASALSGPYKLLDGLFTVPSSGNYYVGIRVTGAAGSAQYLMIDDLSITIPCTANSGNTPTLSASASAQTICAGTSIGLNATGADTYTWSVGQQNGSSISDSPMTSGLMNYTVVGTNTITGCEATAIVPVQVDPAPNVFAVANPPVVCAGSPVIMTAYGANSYAWSNSSIGQVVTVNPATPGTANYTVIGTNAQGCTGTFVQAITVNALPNVVVGSSNPGAACKNDMLTLTATGGVSYQWYSNTNSAILQGNPVNLQAASSTVFTVMATGANGCVGKTTLTQNIEECTGIAKVGALSGVSVYPNPTSGVLTVEFNSNVAKSVSVQDLTGRVIMTANGTDSNITVDLSNLAAGVYYVKLQSEGSVSVVKVVKE